LIEINWDVTVLASIGVVSGSLLIYLLSAYKIRLALDKLNNELIPGLDEDKKDKCVNEFIIWSGVIVFLAGTMLVVVGANFVKLVLGEGGSDYELVVPTLALLSVGGFYCLKYQQYLDQFLNTPLLQPDDQNKKPVS